MKIALKHLTYLNDFDLLRIILSSADKFPGLYRFSSSWKLELERGNFMNVLTFMEACCAASLSKKWTKKEWLNVHERIFNLGFGESGRDSERADRRAGELLKTKAREWVTKASSFSLAVIDINQPVEEIQRDTTYYLMGSLIRFNDKTVEISYNHLKREAHTTLKVEFQDAKNYIEETFGKKSLSELFVKAEIVGELDFDDSGLGSLEFNEEELGMLMINFSGNAPIFASVNYEEILPIRFAKLIGVSNVCQ